MKKLHRKPKRELHFERRFLTMQGDEMNMYYSANNRRYVCMDDEWWQVNKQEYEDTTETFIKIAEYFGKFY